MKLPSVMSHQFSQVPKAEIQRSAFNRGHGLKTTFDTGYLVPIYVDEALPGDTFNMKMTAFARTPSLIFPLMDNLYLDTFFFFVPNRLLWTNWEKFNGAQTNPGDSTSYTIPTVTSAAGGFTVGSLWDYFGLPTVGQVGGGNTITVSALWSRAYNLIYNTWFRDENMINSVTVDTGDGPDTLGNYVLKRRGKRHDYFTSCLPWPQKGTAVTLGLTGSAEVWGSGILPTTSGNQDASPIASWWIDRTTDGAAQAALRAMHATGAAPANSTIANGGAIGYNGTYGGAGNVTTESVGDLVFLNKSLSQAYRGTATAPFTADLSTATSTTINALRQSFQIQRLYERDARGGTRYIEILKSHFGVTSPDYRLQRPEYLGGGSAPINIIPVAKTSSTDGTSPQANLAAFGTMAAHGHGFVKSFTEHGVLIGLANVRADLTYQQGLDRMWSRSTRWDFYWPALAHIGEQAVLTKEIYADGSATDSTVFGYQERYAEYRYKPSKITGLFRSTSAGNIDEWHVSQQFGSAPTLNSTFIEETPPMSRVLSSGYADEILFDAYFDLKCVRPMPVFGVPGLIDHF